MSLSDIKSTVTNNVKNLVGWRTKRKIVVISVDDYGNVRLDSKAARKRMEDAGFKSNNRFDNLDALETREDLEMLYDVLRSVKDSKGNSAVLTPFAMPCNLDFEKIAESGFHEFHNEPLNKTYDKLTEMQPDAYKGTWEMWQQGIEEGLMVPQFHGREHLNLKVFEEFLQKKEPQVINALKNRSYTSVTDNGYKTISTMAAFEFWKFEENQKFGDIIKDGLNQFEQVYGYRSDHFNPPGGREHPVMHEALKDNGIKYLDTYIVKNEHQGNGEFKKTFNFTGKRNKYDQIYIVRNVVFEPTDDRGYDWVKYTMKQIEAAFRWNRPAIISSHRVNFCGHIDPKNRSKGLKKLKLLLKSIKNKWPDVEFMAANDLGDLISGKN